jgi:hypothetical protein
MPDREWREEWDRLLAQRAAARERAARAASDFVARARDPFGLKAAVREHPYVAAGAAAAIGAVLVNLFFGGGRAAADDDGEPARRGSRVVDSVWDAALRAAAPWLANLLREKLAQYVEPGGAAQPAAQQADADAERERDRP